MPVQAQGPLGFLIDENVPYRIKPALAQVFGSGVHLVHAAQLGEKMTDAALWDYAREQSLVLLTKDADFVDRMLLSDAPPPWVVQLRCGNLRVAALRSWLEATLPQVRDLLPGHWLILLYPDRIEALAQPTE